MPKPISDKIDERLVKHYDFTEPLREGAVMARSMCGRYGEWAA